MDIIVKLCRTKGLRMKCDWIDVVMNRPIPLRQYLIFFSLKLLDVQELIIKLGMVTQ